MSVDVGDVDREWSDIEAILRAHIREILTRELLDDLRFRLDAVRENVDDAWELKGMALRDYVRARFRLLDAAEETPVDMDAAAARIEVEAIGCSLLVRLAPTNEQKTRMAKILRAESNEQPPELVAQEASDGRPGDSDGPNCDQEAGLREQVDRELATLMSEAKRAMREDFEADLPRMILDEIDMTLDAREERVEKTKTRK